MTLDKEKTKEIAEEIANRARSSISRICIEECNAYCCRKGFLVMKEKEKDAVVGEKEDEKRLTQNLELKKLDNGKYSLNLANSGGSCPKLKDNKCTIYNHPDRPKACGQFPIYVGENKIMLSPRCLAVKMNAFYPYEKEWIKLGYKIDTGTPLIDSDFFFKVK